MNSGCFLVVCGHHKLIWSISTFDTRVGFWHVAILVLVLAALAVRDFFATCKKHPVELMATKIKSAICTKGEALDILVSFGVTTGILGNLPMIAIQSFFFLGWKFQTTKYLPGGWFVFLQRSSQVSKFQDTSRTRGKLSKNHGFQVVFGCKLL